MKKTLILSNSFEIDFEIIRTSNRHTYLSIKDGKLLVKANQSICEKEIEELIIKKQIWIKKHTNSNTKIRKQEDLSNNDYIYFGGESYKIITNLDTSKVSQNNIYLKVKDNTNYELLVALNDFYAKNLSDLLEEYIDYWADKMQLTPSKISLRNMTSRWGSCSSVGNLSFNVNLAQLPKSVVEYIVIHELAHLKHKNHSAYFWGFVAKFLPEYKKQEKILKEYERKITMYK